MVLVLCLVPAMVWIQQDVRVFERAQQRLLRGRRVPARVGALVGVTVAVSLAIIAATAGTYAATGEMQGWLLGGLARALPDASATVLVTGTMVVGLACTVGVAYIVSGVMPVSAAPRNETHGAGLTVVPAIGAASVLDEHFPRRVAQTLRAALSDRYRFGDLQAAVVEPQRRHEVEGHPDLEHAGVPGAKRHRPFAPIRGVGQPDGVPGTAVLVEPGPVECLVEGVGDVLAPISGPGFSETGFDRLEHRRLGLR